MSQEINLYESRLRPRREWVTARNLGVCLVIVLAVIAGTAVTASRSAARQAEAAAALQAQVKDMQEKLTAAAKVVAERRVSPALAGEVEQTRSLVAERMEAMRLLEADSRENVPGFSGVMAGFARLTRNDLWLTSFRLGRGGQEIEIRGRTLDASGIPRYVQNLGAEDAFRGRRFAALDLREWVPEAAKGGAAAIDSGQVVTPLAPRVIEFILRSERTGEPQGASANTRMEGRAP